MEGGDRFPADNIPHVWLNVFNKLDPKDKLAFSGASSVWHDWVEPQRTESVISEVAPYLLEPCDPVYSGGTLEARELCQSWKEGVDQQNQTHGSNTSLDFEISADEGPDRWYPCRRSRLCGNLFYVADAADVQWFMQDMRTIPGNPFLGRSIGIFCEFEFIEEPEDLSQEWMGYWRSIISLLEMFGSYVHFAEIVFGDYRQNHVGNVEIQAQLRECLLRLPNLKQVKISCVHRRTECPLPEDEIRVFYRLNPLPQLEHLETVELSDTSPATVDEVLNSCCVPTNIKRLSVQRYEQERLPLCEAVYGFVNLEVLKARILFRDLERLQPGAETTTEGSIFVFRRRSLS